MYLTNVDYFPEYLRELSAAELEELIRDARMQLLSLRSEHNVRGHVRSHLFKKIRRDVARIKTVLREKI